MSERSEGINEHMSERGERIDEHGVVVAVERRWLIGAPPQAVTT